MPPRARSLRDLGPAFSVAAAAQAGVSPDALRRVDLRAPFHGTRATLPPQHPSAYLSGILDLVPRLRPWQFVSHETALSVWGVPLPEWPYEPRLHVSAHRPAREPRTAGVVGHRLPLRDPACHTRLGIPVEDPVRAWRQVGTSWTLDELIVAAEHLVSGPHPIATVDELRDEVMRMGDTRRGILRRALTEVRAGSRSPRETRLRLLLVRAGLPEPDVSWRLTDRDGRFVAELDLAYPRWRVGVEYDGRVHAEDAAQFERDADRWERIRRTGWTNVRILNHHMRLGGGAVERVRYALIDAGWRPGQ